MLLSSGVLIFIALTLTFIILFVFTTTLLRLVFIILTSAERRNYGRWLILRGESCLGLVQIHFQVDRCNRHSRHRHLLCGQEDLIGRLEDSLEGGVTELHIADVCPDAHRQLKMPKCFHRGGATTALKLGRLLADILDNLVA